MPYIDNGRRKSEKWSTERTNEESRSSSLTVLAQLPPPAPEIWRAHSHPTVSGQWFVAQYVANHCQLFCVLCCIACGVHTQSYCCCTLCSEKECRIFHGQSLLLLSLYNGANSPMSAVQCPLPVVLVAGARRAAICLLSCLLFGGGGGGGGLALAASAAAVRRKESLPALFSAFSLFHSLNHSSSPHSIEVCYCCC